MGLNRVSIPINQKIYKNFLSEYPVNAFSITERENRKLQSVFFQAKPFFSAVKNALKYRYCEPMKSDKVKYAIKDNEEFFIEPNDDYNELFFKRERYSYQHEVRILLTRKMFGRKLARVNIEIGPVKGRFMFEDLSRIQALMTLL